MSEFGRRRTTVARRFTGQRSFVQAPVRFQRMRRRRRRRRKSRNVRSGGLLDIELKFYDTTLVAQALATNTAGAGGEADPSATILLNTVIQGDGASNRDGKRIMMKSVFVQGIIRGVSQANQVTGDNSPHVGIWLVLDTQTNGVTINSEDVFENKSGNANGGTSLFRNLSNSKRYRILDKLKFGMDAPVLAYDGTNIEQSGVLQSFQLSAKLNMLCNFKVGGTTEDVANIIDNSLHIIAFATNTALALTITYNARLRFTG